MGGLPSAGLLWLTVFSPLRGLLGAVSNGPVPPPRAQNPRERPAHPKKGEEA
jgi:hypothetical protein